MYNKFEYAIMIQNKHNSIYLEFVYMLFMVGQLRYHQNYSSNPNFELYMKCKQTTITSGLYK